jgi:hypothetical protein
MIRQFIVLLLFVGVVACGKKEEATAESELVEWKELDDFHMVMADVFHPLKDSGNVQPIMTRATELADAAEKLAGAPLPEKVNNEEVKRMLEELKTGTRQLASDIADSGEEDTAGTKLYELHDLFHKIQEAWYKGPGEEEGHGDHHEH